MADGSGGTTKPSGSEGDGSSIDPSSALSSRQSKSSSDMFLEFSELENMREDKNSKCLVCRHCKCKVLKPGYGTLLEREVRLLLNVHLLVLCALNMHMGTETALHKLIHVVV